MIDPEAQVTAFECYAWIGEDEYGSGIVGIKRGLTPAGDIPLVSMDLDKISRDEIVHQMQAVVNESGMTRHLVRLVFAAEVSRIEPRGESSQT